jgi:GAF domain-containing protein
MAADSDGEPQDAMELAEAFAEIARALLSEPGLDEVLQHIVDSAVKTVPGCESAGISFIERRRITTAAASDEVPRQVDHVQYETDQGPCLDAIREHAVFVVDDLREEPRWPAFAERAADETGVRSMLAVRLFAEADTLGALNMYSMRPVGFGDDSRAVGAVFAAHAAVAISSSQREENLQKALQSRDVIGQAKGILIAHEHMTADEAYAALKQASQHLNLKLREVADRVVYTGVLPPEADRS